MTSTLKLGAAALGLLLAGQALAADDYHALLRLKRFAQVEQMANARLAATPGDPEALVARTSAILSYGEPRIEEAVQTAENCVKLHPQNGHCQLALGKALGSKAMIRGIMASLGSAGTIRDGFKKAVELDPKDLDARMALLEYYMKAPFIVGGGMDKARTLARDTAAISPEGSKLMLAVIDINDDKAAKAEAAALLVQPGSDTILQEKHEDFLVSLAAMQMGAKKFDDATRLLREARKRYPDSPNVAYFDARLMQEQGRHGEAVATFGAVVTKLPLPYVHYRMAKSLQALGEKPKAVQAYEKSLAGQVGMNKSMKEDAQEQLKLLKA